MMLLQMMVEDYDDGAGSSSVLRAGEVIRVAPAEC